MKKPSFNKKAFRRSFWSSTSRVISVFLAAGSGSIVKEAFGNQLAGLGFAATMAVASLVIMWFAEYERENE